MNKQLIGILILLTAIQINFGCKKEQSLVRIDIKSSRGFVLLDDNIIRTPAAFLWATGSKHHIHSNGSRTSDWVDVTIYREQNKELTQAGRGQVDFIYEVKP